MSSLCLLGTVTSIAGSGLQGWMDGPAVRAKFDCPRDLCLDALHHCLYVADYGNNRIRRIVLEGSCVGSMMHSLLMPCLCDVCVV
jgi:hypothetical protein